MALTDLIGQVLDEKYRIEKQLGKGGMGAVYFATHMGTERPVAVKVIVPQFMKSDEFVERFKREARAAGRLRHPNVVDVTDFGFARVGADRVAYLVMEYLDGCTLDEVLHEESRLPLAWVVDILEQTCSALDEAHQQGIIHRDLKPDNIWLEPNRRGGYTVKVLDFGIAKLANTSTSTNATTSATTTATGATQADASAHSQRSAQAVGQSSTPAVTSTPQPEHARETARHVSSQPHETESSEAATQMIAPPVADNKFDSDDLEESATQMLPAPQKQAEQSEAATQLIPTVSVSQSVSERPAVGAASFDKSAVDKSFANEEDGTRILEQRATHNHPALRTAAVESLTRVGSLLGTPLYMSPEQCRGDVPDARTDIYSLGVIAYQMLAGRTPFKGDVNAVIKQHLEAEPAPLKVKKVPKKVARLVHSALAKNPDARPATVAGFASALRANSEGVGSLLRRALTIFSEHLPTFLRLALVLYIPVILINILNALNNAWRVPKAVTFQFIFHIAASLVLALLQLIASFVAASLLMGVTTRIVTQLFAQPLRPIQLRATFKSLKKRLRRMVLTSVLVGIATFAGFIFFVIPGIYMMVHFSLVTAVLSMEDVKGWAALKRSRTLVRRSRSTVFFIICLQLVVPFAFGALMAFIIVFVIKGINPSAFKANLFNNLFQVFFMPITILFASFSSIVTALLYLKTRMAGGETFKELIGLFDEEQDTARSQWQQRMRTRVHLTKYSSR